MNSRLKVGVTGGIGSGKSTICEVFKLLGIPVYNSDFRARTIMNESEEVKSSLINLFGKESFLPTGEPDRAFIGKTAFRNPELLKQLNQVIHPLVAHDYANWLEIHADKKYTIKEAALLIETGMNKDLDTLIVVAATETIRMSRVLKRDPHRSEADVLAIMKNQLSEEEKIAKADYLIYNDESQSVIQQVLKINNQILEELR